MACLQLPSSLRAAKCGDVKEYRRTIRSLRLHRTRLRREAPCWEPRSKSKLLCTWRGHGSPASRNSVSRASLFFSPAVASVVPAAELYLCRAEVTMMKMPVKWPSITSREGSTVSLKAQPWLPQEGRAAAAAAEAAQRCLSWTHRDQRLWKLPDPPSAALSPSEQQLANSFSEHPNYINQELTDERRARLLHELATSGRLPLGQFLGKEKMRVNHRLQVVNAAAQTPLHCAAASGSCAVAQELLVLLGHEVATIGAAAYTEEASMTGPETESSCDGCANAGPLRKLPQQRQALRECLSGALGRMNPDG
ncbi:unnamed protein product, partial [Symbiodinium pilosum]